MQDAEAGAQALKIGYTVRWSTAGQDGNYRGKEQDDALPAILRRQGFVPVPFTEGRVSGRDLAKRPAALDMLEAVKSGEIDGLGGFDVKRLTRDETGMDAGHMIRVCREARALIVTAERQYRVWQRRDLKDFKRDALDAGENLLDIRDTFWQGIVGKAKREPFFMSVAPTGYTTDIVEARGEAFGQRTKIKRVPRRDEGQADMMVALGKALDESASIGEVVARMNASGMFPPGKRGAVRNADVRWLAVRVETIIANPLYSGTWTFGRHMAADSEIRELSNLSNGAMQPGNTTNGSAVLSLDVPDLAWYSPDRQRAWQVKYKADADAPRRRMRTYAHPLLGVFLCNECDRPMTGHGSLGYSCTEQTCHAPALRCPKPQSLSERCAFDALWALLPRLLAERDDALDVLKAQLADGGTVAQLRGQLEQIRAGLKASVDSYYVGPVLRVVPDALQVRWAETQAEINRREAEINALERASLADGQRERVYHLLAHDPARARDKMTIAQQGAMFRDIVDGVVLRGAGRGRSRRYEVVAWRNKMLATEVSARTARGVAPYLSQLLD